MALDSAIPEVRHNGQCSVVAGIDVDLSRALDWYRTWLTCVGSKGLRPDTHTLCDRGEKDDMRWLVSGLH